MNMLSANAMGLYREQENFADGSVIYYQSNRPITKNEEGLCEFELDSVVYKMTGDGFFVSNDGGLSFTSGFDAEGNAIVNVLSAIGITFDWAKGGTISLGGYDNTNGNIKMYDSEGVLKGKWNKDGIEMQQEDGSVIKITPKDGFYRQVGETKNEYYSIFYQTDVEVTGSYNKTVQLPQEFEGKQVKVSTSYKSCSAGYGSASMNYALTSFSCSGEYVENTNSVKITGKIKSGMWLANGTFLSANGEATISVIVMA